MCLPYSQTPEFLELLKPTPPPHPRDAGCHTTHHLCAFANSEHIQREIKNPHATLHQHIPCRCVLAPTG